MTLADPLPIKPFTVPAHGTVCMPTSKSINNRALILSALCQGQTLVTNALKSRDAKLMVDALHQLGRIEESSYNYYNKFYTTFHSVKILIDPGDWKKTAIINVGNAGTVARFLTAALATIEGGEYTLDGDAEMRNRPMKGLLEALEQQGAEFTWKGAPYHFPFTMETCGLKGGDIEVDASESSQILSALLMAAPMAKDDITIRLKGPTVSEPFVHMTMKMMAKFGINVLEDEIDGRAIYTVKKSDYTPPEGGEYFVEPDATAASYFAALPLVTKGVVEIIDSSATYLQGDLRFIKKVLKDTSLSFEEDPYKGIFTDFIFEYTGPGKGISEDFNDISDTFLTLAAIAPLLEGKTIIKGIAHTRKQETDRVAGVINELKRLGQGAEYYEAADTLTIMPNREKLEEIARTGLTMIETYEDHRFAMSFAILGCADLRPDHKPWLAIENPTCCAKTFPDFFEVLEGLLQQSETNLYIPDAQ